MAGSETSAGVALDSSVPQQNAIHAVPSACSSRWPLGSGFERSKTEMLSRPRKPPEKRLSPPRSSRFTHQVKVRSSFWKRRRRKSRSRAPRGPHIL
jgi:hypothetical protein